MVSGGARPDHRRMTTHHPTIRRLHRRTDDRVLAGVASGLGDYFNVDPLLIRILLVASIVFGGLGIFLYVAAWLLVPDDRLDRSIAERTLGAMSLPGGFLGGLLAVIGALILLGIVSAIVGDGGAGLAVAVIVVAIGALLLRRNEAGTLPPEPQPADGTAAPDDTAEAPPPPPPVAHAAPRVRRPPSPLGWYVVGAALVGIGLLAAADSAGLLFPEPDHYFGLAMLVIGVGLVVGAWWGHARALILVGLMLLPFAWIASLVDVPLEGGWGSRRFAPATSAELREEYRLVGGELVLDLTDYVGTDASVDVNASVGFGQLRVLLPEEAGADIDATVGGGVIRLPGVPRLEGTRLDDRRSIDGDGTTFTLSLDAGIGVIRVDRIPMEDR
jgi:phage shock protein PspC (stress-responsive transcriptional regulator)